MDFSWLSQPQSWIAFGTLAALEIVLGIDNIIFISILSGKLPEAQRAKARTTGLALAMIMRILLLLSSRVDHEVDDAIIYLAVPVNCRAACGAWRTRGGQHSSGYFGARPDPAAGWLVSAGEERA
jgi:hypothetical protein